MTIEKHERNEIDPFLEKKRSQLLQFYGAELKIPVNGQMHAIHAMHGVTSYIDILN